VIAVVVVTDVVVAAVVGGGDVGLEVNLNKFVFKKNIYKFRHCQMLLILQINTL